MRMMVLRVISAIPSYLMIVLVMVIMGIIASGIVINVFLPMTRQRGYFGSDIVYNFHIDDEDDKVSIQIVNRKAYEVKVDVVLITKDRRVVTTCPSGFIEGHYIKFDNTTDYNRSFSLLGIPLRKHEILTIICFIDNIEDVKVYGYGVCDDDVE